MRRIVMVLAVMAVMVAMLVVMAMPAFADKGGVSHQGACGLGKAIAHGAIEEDAGFGASEIARTDPVGLCAGN